MRALPSEEAARIGLEYTEADAIWRHLDEMDGEATLLLRASWLRKQRGSLLPKRGTPLPEEATIRSPELRDIYHAAKGKTGRRQVALPFIAVSHYWRTQQHPVCDRLSRHAARHSRSHT